MNDYKTLDHDEGIEVIDGWKKTGLPTGLSVGWSNLNEHFTAKKGQLNIASGFPSSGKSEFIENIACNMAKNHKWNITMYCPEKYPVESQQLSLLEKIGGKPVIARNGFKAMTFDECIDAEYIVSKRFQIISADDDPYTIEVLLEGIEERVKNGEKIDMVILDPWNELDNGRPSGMSETDYIGYSLMKIRRLARRLNISFWIVCHPVKPAQKDKDGSYPPPDLYDLAGSSHWRNKADNGFIVHRYSLETTRVSVFIKKIKDRFYGKPGEVFFDFLPSCGRYEPAAEEL